jgi:hypothetical protein
MVYLFILLFYVIELFHLRVTFSFSFFLAALRKYKLPMSRIIPFPKRNDPTNATDFPPGSQVLAVYPGTTALYKATVVNGHRKVTILSTSFYLNRSYFSFPLNSNFLKIITLPFEYVYEFGVNLTTSRAFACCGLLSIA